MIDVITVVFRDELEILQVQAQSLDMYAHDLGIQRIYVVVNDDTDVVDAIQPSWWGSLADRVCVVPRQMFSARLPDLGWLSQQILKLLTATLSYQPYSMILDAKTILIQPLELHRLFAPDGRITAGTAPVQTVFAQAARQVGGLFDIDVTHVLMPQGVPFLFDNSAVRAMIAEVELRTQQPFVDWFSAQGTVTEFILYSGYQQWRHSGLDSVTTPALSDYRYCNICHSQVQQFDQRMVMAQHPGTATVSVHRRAWAQISPAQQQVYREFLLSRGIQQAAKI
jgi:hypothetical protein